MPNRSMANSLVSMPVVFDAGIFGGGGSQASATITTSMSTTGRSTGHQTKLVDERQDPPDVCATTDSMKLTDGAKRAYEYLARKTEGKGLISEDGYHLHPAPSVWTGEMFEFNFDKPPRCIIIPRDLLPLTGTDAAIRKAAIRHAATNKEEDVDDMAALIKELRSAVKSKIKGFVLVQHSKDIRDIQIPFKGRTATSKEEVFKAWTSCNPTPELIQKFHALLYDTFGPKMINFITYQTYIYFGLWLDKDAHGVLLTNKQAGDHKAKKCCIRNLVVVAAREHVRGRYSRKSDIPHGIILTISKDEERSELRRRKSNDQFDFRRYVKGWRSQKHIRFCQDNKYDIPSIPSLDSKLPQQTNMTAFFSNPDDNQVSDDMVALAETSNTSEKCSRIDEVSSSAFSWVESCVLTFDLSLIRRRRKTSARRRETKRL